MSLLSAFVGGVAKTRLADMQAADEDKRDLDRFKKQQKILEDMRKSAEDAKVAAKRIVQGGNADEGPQQLMVEEYNPSGRVIGTRAASKGEEDEYVQGKQTRAANLAAATFDAEAKMRDEDRKDADLESKVAYRSAAANAANRRNLAKPDGGVKGQSEATLWKDINNLLGDPDYQAAVKAGDPSVLREMGASDPVIGGLRAAGKAIGVDVPEDSRPNLLREIEQEQDPVVRAQMLASFKRRLEMAAAKGRSGGKGIRPPRNQE